jgi:hypothetical protein
MLVIEFLLQNGANKNLLSKKGKNIWEISNKNLNSDEIIYLINNTK